MDENPYQSPQTKIRFGPKYPFIYRLRRIVGWMRIYYWLLVLVTVIVIGVLKTFGISLR